MQTWYECKVKYLKIDQGGHESKVNDNYLLDAVSFTDAETRIFEQMNEITRGEFQVLNIKKSNISEVINNEEGEWYYKAKISLVTIDEDAGKEKKVNQYILVMADDLDHSLKRLHEGLSYMLVPYVVTSIALCNIAEVFPYDLEAGAQTMTSAVASEPVEITAPVGRELEEIEPVESDNTDDELEEIDEETSSEIEE